MDASLIIFLVFVALGATAQTATGFAMGLIIISGVTVLGLAEIHFSAAVISLLTFVNVVFALRKSYQWVHPLYYGLILLGLLPCVFVGIWLLYQFESEFYKTLERILGVVTLLASFVLLLRAAPTQSRFLTSKPAAVVFGGLSGVLAGLYTAGGLPIAYLMYRQPIGLKVIRATLLAIFATAVSLRITMLLVTGKFTEQILLTSAVSIPVAVFATLVTAKFSARIPDNIVRKLVAGLLMLSGGALIVG